MEGMDNVEFNPEERAFAAGMSQRARAPKGGVTGFFMRRLKTDRESKANTAMVVVAVVFFLVSIFILWKFL